MTRFVNDPAKQAHTPLLFPQQVARLRESGRLLDCLLSEVRGTGSHLSQLPSYRGQLTEQEACSLVEFLCDLREATDRTLAILLAS